MGDVVPKELACVAVEIDGRPAPIFYLASGQINAQAPTTTSVGNVPVRVVLNPGRTNEIRGSGSTVQIGTFSPAFFTFNGSSIAALNASADNQILANPSVVPGGVLAKPGDIVVLYGTGFGFTDPVYQAGEFATVPIKEPLTVTIDGTALAAADVIYAGLSLAAPGFFQFNVKVPATTADGDTPVSIRIGGVSTQAGATIPVKR